MDGILSVENFDASLAEGLMLLTPFSVDEAGSKDFVEAYQAAYNAEPLQFAAGAYVYFRVRLTIGMRSRRPLKRRALRRT